MFLFYIDLLTLLSQLSLVNEKKIIVDLYRQGALDHSLRVKLVKIIRKLNIKKTAYATGLANKIWVPVI